MQADPGLKAPPGFQQILIAKRIYNIAFKLNLVFFLAEPLRSYNPAGKAGELDGADYVLEVGAEVQARPRGLKAPGFKL